MDTTNQILDQPLDMEGGAQFVKVNLASGGQRFANHIIDVIVFYILIFIYGGVLGVMGAFDAYGELSIGWTVSIYLVILFYYIFMEATFGKTIGKMITGTKVVNEDGTKPELMTIIGRTLCRLIPFDAFSFLGSTAVGWHDSISRTRVIRGR